MIVTGGGARLAAVTVYSQRGFVEDLPQLGTGRQWHACGHFVNSEDQPVSGDTDQCWRVRSSASKRSIRRFVITEKAPTRAFSWLKAATNAFTFKTLC